LRCCIDKLRGTRPRTSLSVQAIGRADGWCDDPADASYNKPVKTPYPATHEVLWREQDDLYDLIVPIGYNDAPAVPGLGSAIFLHVARPDYAPTAGCVALSRQDLLEILASLGQDSRITIRGARP
jgi:L,D-peptidoglycan transpeptidase YkuD (ErfK/YbiS/YcfS/YnhG family)